MKKIAIIWYFDKASLIFPKWRDGHKAAFEELENKFEGSWYLDKSMPPPGKFDLLLFWSSSNEDFFKTLEQYSTEKKALCLTTDPTNINNLRKMDIIFVESKPIYDQCRALALPVIKAFGTDTDFFRPNPKVKKDIEYFYPATFSPWKRQSDIAYLGKKLLCLGTIQPDGNGEYVACKAAGVQTKVGYFPAEEILKYYQRSRRVIIPAVHGSERTVLEAMSCNIVPEIVHPDINKRAYSYLVEYLVKTDKTPREFIIEKYSHKVFAKMLKKGIKQCLK